LSDVIMYFLTRANLGLCANGFKLFYYLWKAIWNMEGIMARFNALLKIAGVRF